MSHQTISFVKSGIRIGGYLLLVFTGHVYEVPPLNWAGLVLVVSEILGIYEEVGQA